MQTVLSLGNALNQGTARGKLILNCLASIRNALLLLKEQIRQQNTLSSLLEGIYAFNKLDNSKAYEQRKYLYKKLVLDCQNFGGCH